MRVPLLFTVAALLAAAAQGKPRGLVPREVQAVGSAGPEGPEGAAVAQRLGQEEECAGCKPGARRQHALAGLAGLGGLVGLGGAGTRRDGGGASLRIAGGSDADDGQLPWMVLIEMDTTSMCGGSLISETFILTSAQCASGYSQFRIGVGLTNRYYPSSDYKYAFTYKSIVHEDYEEDRLLNDIGLLQLLYPMSFSDAIRPVKLPSTSDVSNDFENQTGLVSGWGTVSADFTSYRLKFVEQPIMDNQRCIRFFPDYVTDKNICGDGEGAVGICESDAGGPLIVQGEDGVWKQVGVASFGSDMGCLAGYPSVYTRVTEYLQWIESSTGLQL